VASVLFLGFGVKKFFSAFFGSQITIISQFSFVGTTNALLSSQLYHLNKSLSKRTSAYLNFTPFLLLLPFSLFFLKSKAISLKTLNPLSYIFKPT